MKKQQTYYVPALILKSFTIIIALSFIILTVATLVPALKILSMEGADYGSMFFYQVVAYILPLILFAIAFVLNPRKLSILPKSFEALLISITGFIAYSTISLPLTNLIFNNMNVDYQIVEYMYVAVFTILYIAALMLLRRSKKWS